MIDSLTLMVTNYKIGDYSIFAENQKNYVKDFFSNPYYKSFNLRTHLKKYLRNFYGLSITLVSNYNSYKIYKNAQMYIFFSAPKLLFNNNLYELKQDNYRIIVNTLIRILGNLKITINVETIENALVRRMDLSKNIFLPSNVTCGDVLEIVKELKFNRTNLFYIPNEYVKFYSKTLSILFYDKIKEIKKHNGKVPHFYEIVSMAENHILRIEIQFKKRYGIEERLTKICGIQYPRKVTLKDVFSEEIFKIIFNTILQEIYKKLPNIIVAGKEEEQLKKIYGNKYNYITNRIAILKCQKDCGNYEEGIKKAIEIYGENFVEKNKCILVNNENLQNIFTIILENIRNYRPLFNTS